MNTSLYLAKRIIFNSQPSFSRFIIRLAIAATALSVSAMIITLALVNGFQHTVANKVYSFWGDARVQGLAPLRSSVSEDIMFETTPEVAEIIANFPNITNYYAFTIKSVVLKTTDQFEGIMLKGVDRNFSENSFATFIEDGQLPNFASETYNNGVVLSQATAKQLQVNIGDKISCYFIRNGSDIRSRPLEVTGIFKTGIEDYDKTYGICDIRFLQKLQLSDSNQISGYEIKFGGVAGTHMEEALDLSASLPQGVICNPVELLFPNIFDWLDIQNQTKQIVVGIMVAVAAINLITCLLILVIERTRMVGVLKTMGLKNGHIQRIFWIYAMFIAAVGIGIGLLFSLLLLGIQHYTGFIKMDESTYYIDVLPVKIIWWQVWAVVGICFVICTLTLRLPLAYVKRISIVQAIRFR